MNAACRQFKKESEGLKKTTGFCGGETLQLWSREIWIYKWWNAVCRPTCGGAHGVLSERSCSGRNTGWTSFTAHRKHSEWERGENEIPASGLNIYPVSSALHNFMENCSFTAYTCSTGQLHIGNKQLIFSSDQKLCVLPYVTRTTEVMTVQCGFTPSRGNSRYRFQCI